LLQPKGTSARGPDQLGGRGDAARRRARGWQCRGRCATQLGVSPGALGKERAKGRGVAKGPLLAHMAASGPRHPSPRAAARETVRRSVQRAGGPERGTDA
jgi:hypothetical protein